MAFSFFTQELAIDLGTANTVIFMNDKKVIDEPSIVAIDKLTGKAKAVGKLAKNMQGKENQDIRTVRPLKDGVIADFDASEMMIREFIKMIILVQISFAYSPLSVAVFSKLPLAFFLSFLVSAQEILDDNVSVITKLSFKSTDFCYSLTKFGFACFFGYDISNGLFHPT